MEVAKFEQHPRPNRVADTIGSRPPHTSTPGANFSEALQMPTSTESSATPRRKSTVFRKATQRLWLVAGRPRLDDGGLHGVGFSDAAVQLALDAPDQHFDDNKRLRTKVKRRKSRHRRGFEGGVTAS